MDFLSSFIEGNDELKTRLATVSDFGQELDNENNDVPVYDQFNTGIAVTQQSRPRTNLSIDPGELQRCGVTGTIPSAEQGIAMGAMPQPRQLMVDMGDFAPEEMEMDEKKQRKLKAGLNQ
jgi:hypothetical protein